MRISDWSSDVCSSDLLSCDAIVPDQLGLGLGIGPCKAGRNHFARHRIGLDEVQHDAGFGLITRRQEQDHECSTQQRSGRSHKYKGTPRPQDREKLPNTHVAFSCWLVISSSFLRSEEHTSELQSLMRISYA